MSILKKGILYSNRTAYKAYRTGPLLNARLMGVMAKVVECWFIYLL